MSARFTKILVANRGEVACRLLAGARARGCGTVAVFSEADADARHVRLADEAVCLGPPPAMESYLAIEKIIDACRRTGAEAVHPGYGFLAESAAFAAACEDADLVFVGPPADVIALMGDKAAAKARAQEVGVPCVPGYQGADQSVARLAAEAEAIGWPVMIKAAAGGGGRGMRVVAAAEDFAAALANARAEARKAFGSDVVLLEKAIAAPRHVEVQIVADGHGSVLALGDRDCTVQRRHQKVIEEAPAPALSEETRAAMSAAALALARAIGYRSLGTVEFLVDSDGAFYFLEMNTRLQVEHPVTEEVTGLDLVDLQFDIAEGRRLGLDESDVAAGGHAIEMRLYAEDVPAGFVPQTGVLDVVHFPQGRFLRVDRGVDEGEAVSAYYDALLAKLIVRGATRAEAIARARQALAESRILGVTTNKAFLMRCLADPRFAAAEMSTETAAEIAAALPGAPEPAAEGGREWALAAVLFVLSDRKRYGHAGPAWRSTGPAVSPLVLRCGEETKTIRIETEGHDHKVFIDGDVVALTCRTEAEGEVHYVCRGIARSVAYARRGDQLFFDTGAAVWTFTDLTYAPASQAEGAGDGALRAPMSGRVTRLEARPGERVKPGQVVVTIEAMKMEHPLTAPQPGVVASLSVGVGDQVTARQVVAVIEPDEGGDTAEDSRHA